MASKKSSRQILFENIEEALKSSDVIIERTTNLQAKQMLLERRTALEVRLKKLKKKFGIPNTPAND